VFTWVGKVIHGNRQRSKQNKRDLRGTDNPHHEGVLAISRENNEKLDNIEGKIDDLHSDFNGEKDD